MPTSRNVAGAVRRWLGRLFFVPRAILRATDGGADLAILSGGAAITYGCWLHYPPSGFIVGGILGVLFGLVLIVRTGFRT